MKGKIIVISHNLRIGGVERSLIGLLNSIDYTKYIVDLFLFVHDGELLPLLPKEVNLLPENRIYKGQILSVKDNILSLNWRLLIEKYRARKAARKFVKNNHLPAENLVYSNYLQKFALKTLPKISGVTYDLGISFLTPHYIVPNKLRAKKTIAWIHTDYSFFKFDKKSEIEMWGKYDYIASISEDCTKGFINQFPELREKLIIIKNILHPKFIIDQAQAFTVETEMPKRQNQLRFLSIGRFTHEKNFDQIPYIAKVLAEKNVNFKWFLIGFGGDEKLIRSKINSAGMQDHVIILGLKKNPYPYIKACDIYIQPSRSEGKAVTVSEAQILEKPVVITKFATSESQLKNGFDGMIVPLEPDACAAGIYNFLNTPKLIKQLIQNCKDSNYGNESEVEKLYALCQHKYECQY